MLAAMLHFLRVVLLPKVVFHLNRGALFHFGLTE
jgi:hypothetical protein